MESQNVLDVLRALNKRTGYMHFFGVFPIDGLPSTITKPAVIVANTADSTQQTGHWVAFYIPKAGPTEYFDSFGTFPFYPEFYTWLRRVDAHKYVAFNKKRYQSDETAVCGCYAVIFLAKKMKLAVTPDLQFDHDYLSNDKKIRAAFGKLVTNLKIHFNPPLTF